MANKIGDYWMRDGKPQIRTAVPHTGGAAQPCLKQLVDSPTGPRWVRVPATGTNIAQARRQANGAIEQGKAPSTTADHAGSSIYARRRKEASECTETLHRDGVLIDDNGRPVDKAASMREIAKR